MSNLKKERNDQIKALSKQGVLQNEIASRFGLSQTRISAIIHDVLPSIRYCHYCKVRTGPKYNVCRPCKKKNAGLRKIRTKKNTEIRNKERERVLHELRTGPRTCQKCSGSFIGFKRRVCDNCLVTHEPVKKFCIFCNKLTGSRQRVCKVCCPYISSMPKNLEGRDLTRGFVRARDRNTCQDCGFRRSPKTVAAHNKKYGKGKMKSLDVHHLAGICGKKSKGYDKLEDLPLLITLCHRCHFNRHDHSRNATKQASDE